MTWVTQTNWVGQHCCVWHSINTQYTCVCVWTANMSLQLHKSCVIASICILTVSLASLEKFFEKNIMLKAFNETVTILNLLQFHLKSKDHFHLNSINLSYNFRALKLPALCKITMEIKTFLVILHSILSVLTRNMQMLR